MPFLIADNNIFSIMNTKFFTQTTMLFVSISLMLMLLAPITSAEVTELTINPSQTIMPGDAVSISGKASPNEVVWLNSSFEISLPVSDGKYTCDFTGIHFPAGEKKFSVTAENVNNIRASLSPVFWQTIAYPLEGPLNATDSIATISISFPATYHSITIDIYGEKDIKVYGDATDYATSVNLSVAMSIKVNADSNGDFKLDINTEGVPEGEFLIAAGKIEKTAEVVLTEPTPTPTPASTTAAPQTTPIKSETGEKSPSPIPQNKTNQLPQKTTKPSHIPSFGFEAIGCIAIAALITVITRGGGKEKKKNMRISNKNR